MGQAEINMTEFRRDLTEIIDKLDTTGPVRLLDYGITVAEIRSTGPATERVYARDIVDTVLYLSELEVIDDLFRLGVDSIPLLCELAQRTRR
jgi:hypothetical protein